LKPALISFADGSSSWRLSGKRLQRQAVNSGFFSCVEVFDIKKLKSLTPSAEELELTGRGLGYWRWKPLLVSTYLAQLPEDIPGLWYVDAGCSIFSDVSADQQMQTLNTLLETREVGIFFQLPSVFSELKYSKRSAIEVFSLSPSQLESGQIQATAFCVRNSKQGREIINEWNRLSQDKELFDDSNDEPFLKSHAYEGHRHDQSLLSMLLKQSNVDALPDQLNIERTRLLSEIKKAKVSFPVVATRHQSYFDSLSMAFIPRAVRWLQRLLPKKEGWFRH